jgi:hypothetical protein
MQLSLFNVPGAAVGLQKDMTYGSILATLGALCSFGLNPELIQQGQSRTKHLASKFDEEAPAYSTMSGGGYGGRSSSRKVRIFYDDCVPADPQQVNSDLTADATGYAITPNEIRALRGRKPYKLGGDNPIVNGPGGPMPLLINVDEDLTGMADAIAQLSAAEGKMTGESAAAVGLPSGDGALDDSPLQNGAANGQAESDENRGSSRPGRQVVGGGREEVAEGTDLADDAGPPKEPNSKPSKALNRLATEFLGERRRKSLAERLREKIGV